MLNLNNIKAFFEQAKPQKDSSTIGSLEYFNDYMRNMRNHQNNALDNITDNTIGQIIIPTGTGKTRIQIGLHINEMLECQTNNQSCVSVISAHRLLLCNQLLDELSKVALYSGLQFDILYIGSERFNKSSFIKKLDHPNVDVRAVNDTNTTNANDVSDAYHKATQHNRHLIIVTTYNSFAAMSMLPRINLCTYDEAHISLKTNFSENIMTVKHNIKKEFFFTATRIVADGTGMNNVDFFGEVLYSCSPREMIEAGELCTPLIHTMRPYDVSGKYDNDDMLAKEICDAWYHNKKVIKRTSIYPDKIGGKLLVTMRGKEELNNVYNSNVFQNYIKEHNVKVFRISSQDNTSIIEDGCFINDEEFTRNEFSSKLAELEDHEDAILMHIDTLAEGIDLPSITGVLLYRNVNLPKFLQTLGRAARLLPFDRTQLYNNTIKPKEYSKMVKPFFYVILAQGLFTDQSQNVLWRNTVKHLRNEYELKEGEFFLNEVYTTEETERLKTLLYDIEDLFDQGAITQINHYIENLEHNDYDTLLDDLLNTINLKSEELYPNDIKAQKRNNVQQLIKFVKENFKNA